MNVRVLQLNRAAIALLAAVAVWAGAAIGTRALAQTSAPVVTPSGSPSFPRWTGAGYPFGQHFEIMMLHFDQASQALAQATVDRGSDTRMKALARQIIASRGTEIQTLSKAYQQRYGSTPPPWPRGAGGDEYYHMRGGAPGGYPSGMGPGMMGGGYGMMGGGYGHGMMGYGDAYQTMMGVPPSALSGKSLDRAFVVGLTRQDAMAISMATLALQTGDAATRSRAFAIVRERATELKSLVDSYGTELRS